MEALQYQRMMEEQAQYDEEALQVMKDLLIKREEEVKVLEAELESYREKYGPINAIGNEECEVDADEDYQELKSQSSMSENSDSESTSGGDYNAEIEGNPKRSGILQEESGERILDESVLDFGGERSYLLGLLTNLEKKFNLSSDDGIISSEPNSDMVKPEDETTVMYSPSDLSQMEGHENKAIPTMEVSLIRERLRGIEADSGLLKHAAMALQNGGEGTKLLAEIALHLRKLRQSLKVPSEGMDA